MGETFWSFFLLFFVLNLWPVTDWAARNQTLHGIMQLQVQLACIYAKKLDIQEMKIICAMNIRLQPMEGTHGVAKQVVVSKV